MKKKFLSLIIVLFLLISACTTRQAIEATPTLFPGTLSPTADPTTDPEGDLSSSSLEGTHLGLTYQQPDGNRLVEGKGTVETDELLRITLPGQAAWVVGVPYQGGSLWTAVLKDGEVARRRWRQ